jgi:hypothetical protein
MREVGGIAMHQTLRSAIAAITIVLASFPLSARAQVAATEMKLTEKHVEGFIAVQRDISALLEKTHGAVLSAEANEKDKAELMALTRKHGFKNFAEYERVAANISMIIAAIDPQTKMFTDPQALIKKEIEQVSADKSIPEREKRRLLKELTEALKSVPSIQFASNVDIVKKYYEKIDVTTLGGRDADSGATSSVVRTIDE